MMNPLSLYIHKDFHSTTPPRFIVVDADSLLRRIHLTGYAISTGHFKNTRLIRPAYMQPH